MGRLSAGIWAGQEVYNHFNRWSAQGIWQSIFEAAAEPAEPPERMALDSTHVKAHRCAGGGNVWPAPSASGFCSWPKTVCTNVSGLPAMPLTKMEIRAFCSS